MLQRFWSWLTGLLGGDEAVEDRVVRREEARLQNDSSGNSGLPEAPVGLESETAEVHRMSGDQHEKREHSATIEDSQNRYVLEIEYDEWEAKQQALSELPMEPRERVNWAIENDDRDDFEITVWTDDYTPEWVQNLLRQQ